MTSPVRDVTPPPQATEAVAPPSAADIAALARTLRDTHERLRLRPVRDLVASLGGAGRRFLDPTDPIRREALEHLPESSGLSPETSAATLDGMAADWTEDRLERLLVSELGDPVVLDGFVERDGRAVHALGPALCVQIGAGGVPGVGVTAILRSLLVKAPTLLKPARGDALLPSLFARAVREGDPELAESLAVVHWPGGGAAGHAAYLDTALGAAEVVVAYGSDEAVAAVRARTPITARFVAHHHRVSVGVVGRDALEPDRVRAHAEDVAAAVAAYDRRGCVSPQVVFVEEGGAGTPREFAALLAESLARAEARWPSGALDVAAASALQQARGTAQLLAASEGGEVHHGGSAAWTVVLEPGAGGVDGVGRWVRVRPIADARDLPAALAPLHAHLQTVGFAGLEGRLDAVAKALGGAGASRVAPFRSVPYPPAWWHHDGRGPLVDLVRWVDLEAGGGAYSS